jgi:L-fuconolactonase
VKNQPARTVVDAHHHFWRRGESHQPWRQPDQDVLDRSFQPAELQYQLHAAGVDRSVLIQSVNTEAENHRLLTYAERVDFVAGVVAWLPLDDIPTANALLPQLTSSPAVRGIRCLIGRDSLHWLRNPACMDILAELARHGLTWDVVPVTTDQLREVLTTAETVPGLRIIIDHLGRPPIESGSWQPWARQLHQLAASPNVAVKISVGIDVLTAWNTWSIDPLQPYIDEIYESFGANRMMLASNWPVIELRATYARAWSDLERATRATGMSETELSAVKGGTACHWYKLTQQ